ncbi:type II toxin-antitoxin system prevent-host-death family antitoxin [Nonomuraea sp. NPDC049750]|uniref:type II toxin-antitoxin system Phd/YefM family antitoxin n=1 Tax=Nonomuraea sp. NPDC049750 TaxID=3154738 RepID=UPI0033D89B01
MTTAADDHGRAATLDAVIDDQEEVLITRPGGEGVVMVSQREYESIRETLYLMASPVNRRRLSEAVARLEAGGGAVRELADEDTTSSRSFSTNSPGRSTATGGEKIDGSSRGSTS